MKKSVTCTSTTFTFDHVKKTINGSKTDFERAGIPGSAFEAQLMERIAAHPDYTLNPIAIRKKEKKKTYAGLNRQLMRKFIMIQEDHKEVLAKFEEQLNDGVSFPTIKSWFLDQYKGFNVAKAEKQISEHRLNTTKQKYAVKVVAKSGTLTLPKAVNE